MVSFRNIPLEKGPATISLRFNDFLKISFHPSMIVDFVDPLVIAVLFPLEKSTMFMYITISSIVIDADDSGRAFTGVPCVSSVTSKDASRLRTIFEGDFHGTALFECHALGQGHKAKEQNEPHRFKG